jgi:hypothetical protein
VSKLSENIKDESFVQRFWRKVKKTSGCWLWQGSNTKGYGTLQSRSDGPLYAHRVSFALHYADPGHLLVCRTCDNPSCVNPEHFFLGTSADNTRDAWLKGRLPLPRNAPVGEAHHHAKLNRGDVVEIRKRLSSGEVGAVLAREYGVSKTTVSNIRKGKIWKSVKA